MIEPSKLNKTKIKLLIKQHYNLNIINIQKLKRGSSNIYLLDDKYILKECVSYQKPERIIKEYNVLKHLKKKGLSVPNFIETTEGTPFVKNEENIILLQHDVKGRYIENNQATK